MKKMIVVLSLFVFLFVSGCSDNLILKGKEYETYGLINESDVKDPAIKYKPCWGNIIWGCILIETIIGPIYFFGFDMFEPVGLKQNS